MNKKQRKQHCLNIASSGGKASAKKLTKKQRSEKAREAAKARWFAYRANTEDYL